MRPRDPADHRLTGRRSRTTPAVALLVAALPALALAGPGAAAADAKARHAPCPTDGTTLLRSGRYDVLGVRVSRVGDRLRICTRAPGQRRRVRALGAWSPATRLQLSGATLAWTTRRTAPDGTAADTIRVIDVPTGRRRLTVGNAAAAPDAATPSSKDTVLRLIADDRVTVWVTTGGRLAAAVRDPAHVPAPDEGPQAFHTGHVYALRDVGPARAATLAAGLALVDDSQTDDCGGTASRLLSIPAVEGIPAGQFDYFREEVEAGPGCF